MDGSEGEGEGAAPRVPPEGASAVPRSEASLRPGRPKVHVMMKGAHAARSTVDTMAHADGETFRLIRFVGKEMVEVISPCGSRKGKLLRRWVDDLVWWTWDSDQGSDVEEDE